MTVEDLCFWRRIKGVGFFFKGFLDGCNGSELYFVLFESRIKGISNDQEKY